MSLQNQILPELWDAVRHHYESQSFSSALLDAINHLGEVLRTKSGLLSDGVPLVGQALGGKEPKIKLNRMVTESEQNVQAGMESLVRGLYQAVRNPRSHGRLEDNKQDTDAIITFVNYILSQLGQAKSAFSIENVIERLQDRNFVPSERYAALILAEVPKTKRLDTMIAAFENRPQNSQSLAAFFEVGLSGLDEGDLGNFFEVVTKSLQMTNNDAELRTVFQVIKPSRWLLIGESARLRCEHWIARNAALGRLDIASGKCQDGALSTWAVSFFSKFTMKREVLDVLVKGLENGDRAKRAYVIRYLLPSVTDLADAPPHSFVRVINSLLAKGNSEIKEAMVNVLAFEEQPWIGPFELAMTKFKVQSQIDDFEDDDIPF